MGSPTQEAPRIINHEVATMPEVDRYIVKTKFGKAYEFDTREEAEQFAATKSRQIKKKQGCCSVYKGDNYVCGYAGGKKLRQWNTIYAYRPVHLNELSYKLETCEDGVRLQTWSLHTTTTNKIKRTFFQTRNSLTFYDNGDAYFWHTASNAACKAQVRHNTEFSLGEFPVKRCSKMFFNILKKELTTRKPELQILYDKIMYAENRHYDNDTHITDVRALLITYCRPNALFKIDTYKNTIQPRTSIPLKLPGLMWYFPTHIVDESKVVEAIAARMKIPCTKYFKKLYAADPQNILRVKYITQLGFKNCDNIISAFLKHNFKDIPSFWIDQSERSFCKKLIKTRGERWAIKNCNWTMTGDIIRMIRGGKIENDIVNYIIKNAKNETEIHNTVLDVYHHHTQGIENVPFKYSKTIKEYERNYGISIHFSLPADSRELALIGATMGICVGSYSKIVQRKQCVIVTLMERDKYVACIEVRNGKVVQLKAKFNNYVKPAYKPFLDKWAKDCNLQFNTSDYDNIGSPWVSVHDYHQVNVHDFDRAEEPWKLHIVKTHPLPADGLPF